MKEHEVLTIGPASPSVGRNGTNVQDLWSDIPTHYLSVAIGPDFPNFFMVNGPNSTLGSGSLLVLFEREVEYIVKVGTRRLAFACSCLVPRT